jgi:hypothetical protein
MTGGKKLGSSDKRATKQGASEGNDYSPSPQSSPLKGEEDQGMGFS